MLRNQVVISVIHDRELVKLKTKEDLTTSNATKLHGHMIRYTILSGSKYIPTLIPKHATKKQCNWVHIKSRIFFFVWLYWHNQDQ